MLKSSYFASLTGNIGIFSGQILLYPYLQIINKKANKEKEKIMGIGWPIM